MSEAEHYLEIGHFIKAAAVERWLCAEELFLLLSTEPSRFGFIISTQAPSHPTNGDLLFYQSMDSKSTKNDGVEWRKKKKENRLQETYQNVKVNGIDMIRGVYVRATGNSNFKRRIYRLSITENRKFSVVHYRQCPEDERPEKIILHPLVLNYWNKSLHVLMEKINENNKAKTTHMTADNFKSFYENNNNDNNIKNEKHDDDDEFNQTIDNLDYNIKKNEELIKAENLNLNIQNSNFQNNHMNEEIDFNSNVFDSEMMEALCGFSPIQMDLSLGFNEGQQNPEGKNISTFSRSSSDNMDQGEENEFPFSIIDFSPSFVDENPSNPHISGTKILICLSSEIPEWIKKEKNIHICFEAQAVNNQTQKVKFLAKADILTGSVLKCLTPNCPKPSKCLISVCDKQGNPYCNPSNEIFEFKASELLPTGSSQLGKRGSTATSTYNPTSTSTPMFQQLYNQQHQQQLTLSTKQQQQLEQSFRWNHSPAARSLSPFTGLNSPARDGKLDKNHNFSREDDAFDRENKIRIVEKLGNMTSVLLSEEGSLPSPVGFNGFCGRLPVPPKDQRIKTHSTLTEIPILPLTNNPIETAENEEGTMSRGMDFGFSDGVEWLDDHQLSVMSNAELEVIMDRYIMVVVKQLVQLAALDDDLKAEIDSLDASGFSLMHYCCLYNLNSLVPVLLARGSDLNTRTSGNWTALHLAAGAGHLAVTQVLVDSGAEVSAVDSNGLTPADIAQQNGFLDIYCFLLSISGPESTRSMDSLEQMPIKIEKSSNNELKKIPGIPEMQPLIIKETNINEYRDYENDEISPLTSRKNTPKSEAPNSTPLSTNSFKNPSPSMSKNTSFTTPNGVSSINSSSVPTSDGNDPLSNKLLHDAFSSLSLTDKCALSLSISGEPTESMNSDQTTKDDISEMQGVLSESERGSLGLAMSLMGQFELDQVEVEVRRIQNNVRGWLLRKNYTNLREAAKVLQVAWREKKRGGSNSNNSYTETVIVRQLSEENVRMNSINSGVLTHESEESSGCPSPNRTISRNTSRASSVSLGLIEQDTGLNPSFKTGQGNLSSDPKDRELLAAATLQAATRGYIARRAFSSIRKQTMASLVIQKSLMKWWLQNKGLNCPSAG